jgi:flavodoxin
MATVSLLVGSVTGTALATAHALERRLHELGFKVEFIEDGSLPQEAGPWLICTSTTGSGDVPPNLWPFYQALTQGLYLPQQTFAVLALGDSAYANFAQSGRDIFTALIDCAAQPLADIYILDAIYTSDHGAEALQWLETWVQKIHA